ncbi:hypothetical protein MASR2M15_04130 [Anaerolineales bacterium]
MPLNLADIMLARYRISPYLAPTPLEQAMGFEQVYFKLENQNKTHSFKIRGAINALLALSETEKQKGIITVSSGNHAQAIAYAAKLSGTQAKIIMPAHTPQKKVKGAQFWGAEVLLDAKNFDEAELKGRQIEKEQGLYFISPYNDPQVVAGAGTCGVEIIDQLADLERLVVPISGGGLMAGVACAVKSLKPDVEIIGVNARTSPAMYNLFYDQHLAHNDETLAEALSGDIEAGSITIELCKQYVDQIVLVDETQIAQAMRWMLEVQGLLTEGGAVVGVAALLNNLIPTDGKKTVVVISGANVDSATIQKILKD